MLRSPARWAPPAPFLSDVVVSRCVVSRNPITSLIRASSLRFFALSGLPTAGLGSHASPRRSIVHLPPRRAAQTGPRRFSRHCLGKTPLRRQRYAGSACSRLTPIWSIDFMPLPLFQSFLHHITRSPLLSTPNCSLRNRNPETSFLCMRFLHGCGRVPNSRNAPGRRYTKMYLPAGTSAPEKWGRAHVPVSSQTSSAERAGPCLPSSDRNTDPLIARYQSRGVFPKGAVYPLTAIRHQPRSGYGGVAHRRGQKLVSM